MHRQIIFLTCFLLALLFFHLVKTPALAETMLSPSYQLRFGNFNLTSGHKNSTNYHLTDTVGQTAANEFTSSGYTLKAGAQYLYTLEDFSFSLSATNIDFGTLLLSTLNQSSPLTLTVSAPRQGYTVSTIATTRLKKGTDYIANTNCNSGCTKTAAGVWTNTNSYGFGYNISGDDVPADFVNNTYFRPFPDQSNADPPAVIMTTNQAAQNRQATTIYQLVLDPSQPVGNYENMIIYIATPNY